LSNLKRHHVTDIQRAAAGRKTPDLNGMTFGRL